jgi:hypothetical protein
VRALSGLWRWRRNPLCRTTDLVEAWTALVALLLVVVASPVTGWLVGSAVQGVLQKSVREQRQARHLVTATVLGRLGAVAPESDSDPETSRVIRSRVTAAWTAPDGTRHRGPLLAPLRTPRPGDRFPLWTDRHGRIVPRPLDPAAATVHAVLAGVGAALPAAGIVEGARRLVVWRLMRRRFAQWDRAWQRAGPDWGRMGTGS